jgi:wobble nucleotide-excising tRNase
MIEYIKLIRNIGQFDSVASGGQMPLKRLTLIYAENGRGKTTLAAMLRSLASGDPLPIIERRRLAAANPPHVVVAPAGGSPVIFQNDAWSQRIPEIVVFDDLFVRENVHAGLEVETEQRQNLHELILGAHGVALNRSLQAHVAKIEEHNRTLRTKSDAIPAAIRGSFSVDAFCALQERADIDLAIQEAERNLAAARASDAVSQQALFDTISLPEFDGAAIVSLLQRGLADLDTGGAARVQAHLSSLGGGSEIWVGDGMNRLEAVRAAAGRDICPFCAQDLGGSAILAHYRAYFSAGYDALKQAIARELATLSATHSGEVMAAFERSVRIAVELRQFWSRFTEIPEVDLDTAAVARAWKAVLEPLVAVLQAKQAAPLDRLGLPSEVAPALATYDALRGEVASVSNVLQAINEQIAIVKEKAAAANVAALATDLAQLQTVERRYRPEIAALCDGYVQEKAAKTETEGLRDRARYELEQYRTTVFPQYEVAINNYLQRFNAGFRLTQVAPVNTRGGSAVSYSVLINTVAVPLAGGNTPGPSFRNTLSAGDRNALALAFFFASLERDPHRAQKIVVIDDPISSLDEHRSLVTIQEMRRLVHGVDQVILLSHFKPFLCALWQGADTTGRVAIKLDRDGTGSTLTVWDVNQDAITEHDRRCRLVRDYLGTHNAADERAVAGALRPILESFIRVAYSEVFPPGALLGPFIGMCEQRLGTPQQILSAADTSELRDLVDYANQFHHDTNPAWQTVTINDSELTHFSQRVVAFTRRPLATQVTATAGMMVEATAGVRIRR